MHHANILSDEIMTSLESREIGSEQVFDLTTTHSFQLCAKEIDHKRYLIDARNEIDKWSKRFNAAGIDRLIAAIIVEYVGNGYIGKDN